MDELNHIVEQIREIDKRIAALSGQRRTLANRRDYLAIQPRRRGRLTATAASAGKLTTLKDAVQTLKDARKPLPTSELLASLRDKNADINENTLRSHLLRLKREKAISYNKGTKRWSLPMAQ